MFVKLLILFCGIQRSVYKPNGRTEQGDKVIFYSLRFHLMMLLHILSCLVGNREFQRTVDLTLASDDTTGITASE